MAAGRRRRPREDKTTEAVNSLFTTAPHNRSNAKKIEDVGKARSSKRKEAESTQQERLKQSRTMHGDPRVEIATEDFPQLDLPWMKIQERIIDSVADPEAEYEELEGALRLTEALTPGNLQAALNDAEDNARRAHRLYIIARVLYEKYELEMVRVTEAMRDAATRDLQGEKDRKERSKQITDADVSGRASILFPDEWVIAQERWKSAKGMLDHLKNFSERWESRCYSLSNMLNAGKRA